MAQDVSFESYLWSKKIDAAAFEAAEPGLYDAWKREFDQLHPNSFTVQKLNLINPIRRKYHRETAATVSADPEGSQQQPGSPPAAPKPGKPVMRPRPKIG